MALTSRVISGGSDIVALIPARGGSKGIPRKNIKLMAGKPMIAWTIEAAKRSQNLRRVVVSTDDVEIASVARDFGAEVPFMRPPELATDSATGLSVTMHFLDWMDRNDRLPDYVMELQPTTPLRLDCDIDAAILLANQRQARAVVGVCELSSDAAHPWLAKSLRSDGSIQDFLPQKKSVVQRQDLPSVYTINGAIFLYRTLDLQRSQDYYPPGTLGYVMPASRSIDVNTPFDFHLVELILEHEHKIPKDS